MHTATANHLFDVMVDEYHLAGQIEIHGYKGPTPGLDTQRDALVEELNYARKHFPCELDTAQQRFDDWQHIPY